MKTQHHTTAPAVVTITSPEKRPSGGTGTLAKAGLLEAALASSPILIWAADREGTLLMVQGGGTLLAGLSPETVQGRPVADVFRDVPELLDQFQQAAAGEAAVGTVVFHDEIVARPERSPHRRKHRRRVSEEPSRDADDCSRFLMDCWAAPLHGPDGQLSGAVGVAADVTARDLVRRQLLAELRASGKLLQSYEQDRRLMAHEVHDGLIQEATAAQMRLQALLASDRVAPGLVRQELEVVLGLVRDTVSEARQFIMGIRPPVLEERGLEEALAN